MTATSGTVATLMATAVAAHRAGRLVDAARLYQQILRAESGHREALYYGAVLELQSGHPDQAYRLLMQAVRLHGEQGIFLVELAVACCELGKPSEAIRHAIRAAIQDPGQSRLYGSLAFAFDDLGDPRQTVAAAERSLHLRPGQTTVLECLAKAQMALENFGAAERHLRQILRQHPDHRRAYAMLGNLLMETGRTEEAWTRFRQAIVVAPQLAEFYHAAGWVLLLMVRKAAATLNFRRALRISPQSAQYYRGFVEVTKVTAAMPEVAAMEQSLREGAALTASQRTELHFALGKAYDDLGQHDRSFDHLLIANRLKRTASPYDEPGTLAVLDQVRAAVTPALIRAKTGLGEPSPRPVFILGMPRSGSSLVEQILASHPQVFGAGEQTLLSRAVKKITGDHWTPDWLEKLSDDDWRRIGAEYVAGLTAIAPDSARIIDKMPNNFRFVGLIHLVLPGAKIIHTIRDPLDTCLSCFSKLFATGISYSYDLGELGRYYRAYERLMKYWHDVLPQGTILDVRYEDVVNDLEGQARRLVAYCGLPWDDACLSFHETERRVWTASVSQVRQPIYKSSVGRWRPNAELLAPLTDALENG